MKKIFIWVLSGFTAFIGVAAFIWFANPFDLRDRVLVSQIVKMRVAPKRLAIPKTPAIMRCSIAMSILLPRIIFG